MHRGNYALANGANPSNSSSNSPALAKDSDSTLVVHTEVASKETNSSVLGNKPFPFVSYSDYDNAIRPLAHGLKAGKSYIISKAAEMMSPMIAKAANGRQCVLIPIPGHNGTAGYTKDLCDAIGARLNMKTDDVLAGNRHIALYHAKKNEMKPNGIPIIFRLKHPLPENIVPIVVDNVLDTGHTAMAAVRALSSENTILAVLGNTNRYIDNKEANFVKIDNGLPKRTKGKKAGKAKKASAKKKTSKKKTTKKNIGRSEKKTANVAEKPKSNVIKSRAPQLLTINGEKVTHAHAFESNANPGTWYFTARIDGSQLPPKLMRYEDIETLRAGKEDIEKLMQTYYPTKLLKKVSKEDYQSDIYLSDGRKIEKFNVFKERNENREDFGRYKMYVEIGDTKMSAPLDATSLEAYFDRVTTPARLVESKLGDRLHLASAYTKFVLPEPSPLRDIRVFKDTDSIWKIGAAAVSDTKLAVPVSSTDLHSFFQTHTVTREQLAAKYLMPVCERMHSQETNNLYHQPTDMNKQQETMKDSVNDSLSAQKSGKKETPTNFQEFFEGMKARHHGALFLFRRGDFLESYNEDARAVGDVLRVTVTSPPANTIPFIKDQAMFPHHTLDTYLPRLIRAGYRVAIMDDPPLELFQSTKDKLKIMNSTKEKPQVRQQEASLTAPKAGTKEKAVSENVEKNVVKSTKDQRDKFTADIVTIAGKNNHNTFTAKFGKDALMSENAKGKEVGLTGVNVLRGRVTFQTIDGNKMQLRDFSARGLEMISKDVLKYASIAKNASEKQAADRTAKVEELNAPKVASKAEQDKFVADIKALMGTEKSVSLPNFGTKEGVVASAGNKGVSLSRVYNWNDNISFQGTVPGDDSKQVRYYHPKDIRPEFYDYLTNEVKKSLAPQLVTENGKKVTNASLFQAKDDSSKYLFTARLDGVGLHPKVVDPSDVDKYMKQEMSVKDMFAKYYPTKMAKQLDEEQFNSLKLSDGRELTKLRVYKQQKQEKPHFGEYLMYAEMNDRRYHATPMSHDQLDAYFDRTMPKGQLAEKVIGEQLHLASAYSKYILPPVEGLAVATRKTTEGAWVISASVEGKGQTPEKRLTGDDLCSLFKEKTATRSQLAAKYLIEDIKDLVGRSQKVDRQQGLKL